MYANSQNVDMDKEYWPSLNTTRFREYANFNDKIIQNFLKVTEEQTQAARVYLQRKNVRYGSDNGEDNQLLDIYYKDKENDTPIFVFIHGGYWQMGDKSTAGTFVLPLVSKGYRVLVVDHNLCPQVTLKQLTAQMWNFFNWLFKYAQQTNASKISICGHSAGAHLAALIMQEKLIQLSKVSCLTSLFLISGIYDLRECWNLESVNPKNIFSLNNMDEATALSPICWPYAKDLVKFCQDNAVKVHVLVAENESATFVGQSREYAKLLEKAGFAVNYEVFEKYDHFDIIEEVPKTGNAINRYFMKHL